MFFPASAEQLAQLTLLRVKAEQTTPPPGIDQEGLCQQWQEPRATLHYRDPPLPL